MSGITDRPRLRLDFTAPSTPPPTYSPYTYQPPSPPFSPTMSEHSPSTSPSASSPSSPKTPASQRIIMGVLVSSPVLGSGEEEDEQSFSLEVPGIVLTEPPRAPSPRLPSPPPKQTVLLAPTSLPIPPSSPPSTSTATLEKQAQALYTGYFTRPSTLNLFLKSERRSASPTARAIASVRTTILLLMLILGAWHLWSTLQLGSLVEDAFEVL